MEPSSSSVAVDDVEKAGLSCGVLPPEDWLQALEARPELVAGVTVEHILPHTVEGVAGIAVASERLNKTENIGIKLRYVLGRVSGVLRIDHLHNNAKFSLMQLANLHAFLLQTPETFDEAAACAAAQSFIPIPVRGN